MATVRLTEAELARDIHAVLARVRSGDEVIVEEDDRAVAVISTPRGPGRPLSDCIARAKAFESHWAQAQAPDADFARDVEEAIRSHREPLDPPAWD